MTSITHQRTAAPKSTVRWLSAMRRWLFVTVAANVLLAIFVAATPAIAQTSGTPIAPSDINLTVGDCDPSMNLLNAILSGGGGQTFKGDFRGEGTTCRAASYVWKASSPTGPVAKLFLYLNTLAMVFAGFLLIYIMVVGTLRSAEDGEILGKSWSTLWVPLRASIGFAALVPTSSGFSWVQIGVLWLASQGVGGGNYLWSHTVKDTFENPGELVAIRAADSAGMSNILRSVLKSETCMHYVNNQLAAAGLPESYVRSVEHDDKGGMVITWGNRTPGLYDTSECGKVVVDGRDSLANPLNLFSGNLLRAQVVVQNAQSAGILRAADNMSAIAAELAAEAAATQPTQAVAGDAAAAASADPNGPAPSAAVIKDTSKLQELALQKRIRSVVMVAADKMRETIAAEATTQAGALSDSGTGKTLSEITKSITNGVVEDASRNGWIGAGAFYYTIANVNNAINEVTTKLPTAEPPRTTDDSAQFGLPEHISARIDGAFDPASMKGQDWTAGSSDMDNMIGSKFNGANDIVRRWTYEVFSVDPTNDKHALVQLKNVGDAIVSTAEVLLYGSAISAIAPSNVVTKAVGTAADKVSGTIGQFPPFQKLGSMINKDAGAVAMVFGCLLLMGILIGAIMLAYWIPLAPFIIWIGGVFGWCVSILEMMGASILWAAANLHPEGEGMASKYGANGYMIIIEICLRPALMIVGLLMSFVAVDPFLRFSSALFFKSMSIANQDTFAALIGFVCFVAIYVGFCIVMVHRCHALIHMVPNAIFKWIGSHANSYDDGKVADSIQASVQGYLQKTGSAAQSAAPGVAAGMMGGKRGKKASSEGERHVDLDPRTSGVDTTAQ